MSNKMKTSILLIVDGEPLLLNLPDGSYSSFIQSDNSITIHIDDWSVTATRDEEHDDLWSIIDTTPDGTSQPIISTIHKLIDKVKSVYDHLMEYQASFDDGLDFDPENPKI